MEPANSKRAAFKQKASEINAFMRALKPISSKTLSSKLKELMACGVISKDVFAENASF